MRFGPKPNAFFLAFLLRAISTKVARDLVQGKPLVCIDLEIERSKSESDLWIEYVKASIDLHIASFFALEWVVGIEIKETGVSLPGLL